MTTPLRSGSPVHAGELAQSGAFIGSPCRYLGTLAATQEGRRYVKLNDGSVRRFHNEALHHADDCPTPETVKGRRR